MKSERQEWMVGEQHSFNKIAAHHMRIGTDQILTLFKAIIEMGRKNTFMFKWHCIKNDDSGTSMIPSAATEIAGVAQSALPAAEFPESVSLEQPTTTGGC